MLIAPDLIQLRYPTASEVTYNGHVSKSVADGEGEILPGTYRVVGPAASGGESLVAGTGDSGVGHASPAESKPWTSSLKGCNLATRVPGTASTTAIFRNPHNQKG